MLKQQTKSRVIQFLMKLRPEFEATRSQLISSNTTDFDKVLGDLIRTETRLHTQAQIDGSNSSSVGTVFAAHSHSRSNWPQFSAASPTELRCRHCNEIGHSISICKKRNFCNYCKRTGHIITDCRTRQRFGSRDGNRSQFSAGSSSSIPRPTSFAVQSHVAPAAPAASIDIHELVQAAIAQALPTALQNAFAAFGASGSEEQGSDRDGK
ncbi:hypothetical protein LINGRAHAP2_LOCUS5288 [Linum grandiflorum]